MMTVNLIFYQKIKCEFLYSANAMKNITKNYQLGFGSFVDKTVSPFIRTEYVYVDHGPPFLLIFYPGLLE